MLKLDALAPAAHPGWVWVRRGWAICELATWLPRGGHLVETYSAGGVVFERGALPIPRWYVLSEPTAWAVWGTVIASLVLLWFGRLNRLWILLALLGIWTLNFHEGLNFKAYDRLMFWQGLVLLAAPGGGTGQAGNPAARYAWMLVYCGIYGSTGWMKALFEKSWASGEVLRYALADNNFGLRPIGTMLAGSSWHVAPLGWGTLLFECLFPVVVWFKRARPGWLLLGAGMHLGILLTMHVNTFSYAAVMGYAVMLEADQLARLAAWLRRWWMVAAAFLATLLSGDLGPRVAKRIYGPSTDAPFTVPDPTVRATLRGDVEALTAAGPRTDDAALDHARAHIRARWEAAGWAVREDGGTLAAVNGDSRRCYAAHYDSRGKGVGAADDATGIAALLALADRRAGARLYAFAGDLEVADCDVVILLDSLGRLRHGHGTQAWPGPWGWVLPWEGNFLGVAGGGRDAVVEELRARSVVPVMALPGSVPLDTWRGHGGALPDGAVLLTDTGPLRQRDLPENVDYDALTWIVSAL